MDAGLYTLPLLGLLAGGVLGYIARTNFFCTLSSLESLWYGQNATGARVWLLAITTAIASTQLATYLDYAQTGEAFYLEPEFSWFGTIVGGVSFGVGMALVGTCGFGALVRLGGGSLKSLMAVTVLGIIALSTQRGLLSYFSDAIQGIGQIDLSAYGTLALPEIIAAHTSQPVGMASSFIIPALLLMWIFRDREFRLNLSGIATGVLIGLVITFGWIATSFVARTSFEAVQIESTSFVAPVSDVVMQFAIITDAVPDYSIGLLVGVIAGSAFAAWRSNNVRWEACDDARELSRHIIGAGLMGFGGILALGCTIGQGISAMSLLSISAPLAMASILVGARLGLAYLLEGSPFAAIRL